MSNEIKFKLAENLKLEIERLESGLEKSGIEWALYHALLLYREDVSALFDGCKTFYEFHKCFRQIDVTPTAHGDMIIWELIKESVLIADVFKKTKKQERIKSKK